ncbi:hypothetical protein [Chitiniphilus eburneus]|uniref:hypothetical protein n=1 Tax=Chitiniphilus eburneus TaxID=2571148 RepID=UPI0035D09C42
MSAPDVDGFAFDSGHQVFAMVNPALSRKLRVQRAGNSNRYCWIAAEIWVAGSREPVMRASHWTYADRNSDIPDNSALLGSGESVLFWVGDLQFDGIACHERDRLVALAREMRGYKLRYTPNIFGYLGHDDSHICQEIALPFPAIEGDDHVQA